MLAAASPVASQIWRVNAATEVLPLVPVTAAMVSGWCLKKRAAASASARRALPTRTKATPSGSGTGGTFSAMIATAPASIAAPHEAQAVVLGAGHRHEQVSGLDLAAVGRDAAHVEVGEPRVADGIDGEELGEFHAFGLGGAAGYPYRHAASRLHGHPRPD